MVDVSAVRLAGIRRRLADGEPGLEDLDFLVGLLDTSETQVRSLYGQLELRTASVRALAGALEATVDAHDRLPARSRRRWVR